MRFLAPVALAAAALASVSAHAANTCDARPLFCPTTMPIDGYCVCTGKGGQWADGTVIPKLPPGQKYNAGTGGCGANPKDPGCR